MESSVEIRRAASNQGSIADSVSLSVDGPDLKLRRLIAASCSRISRTTSRARMVELMTKMTDRSAASPAVSGADRIRVGRSHVADGGMSSLYHRFRANLNQSCCVHLGAGRCLSASKTRLPVLISMKVGRGMVDSSTGDRSLDSGYAAGVDAGEIEACPRHTRDNTS